MVHSLASLENLGKSDSTRLVMGYQNKLDTALIKINSELNKFIKLESDLEISRNAITKLVYQVTRLERKCWENEQ